MYSIGVDVGSTYTKYCVLDDHGAMVELFSEKTPIRPKMHFALQIPKLYHKYGDCRIVSCGYGRRNLTFDRTVNELTALAAGVEFQCPGAGMVLDIGGQDTKIICQKDGRLQEFFVNDKCAAGCGMFLLNVLHMLDLGLEEVELSLAPEEPELHLSSKCAVFAQSEIVELMAADIPAMAIVRAVLWHIFIQAKGLLRKAEATSVVLSGGLTHIQGVGRLAKELLGIEVIIPENGAYLSALGCAVLCRDRRNPG